MKRPKEWLTFRIAMSYRERYLRFENPTAKERYKLIHEIMERCGTTELEATNIIYGYNIQDYVRKYEIQREKYMDILLNGEKTEKLRVRRRKRRPQIDPNQLKLISSHKASGQ